MIRGNIIISEKAVNDLFSIRRWYNDHKDSLGDDFLISLEKMLLKIEQHPSSFKYITKDVRRCTLRRFPYYIYFAYSNGIEILRVRHKKQSSLQRFR